MGLTSRTSQEWLIAEALGADVLSMDESNVSVIHDPYRRCEEVCTHDLTRGILVSELLGDDGPYPDTHPLLVFRAFPRRHPATQPVAAAS